ncbi:MAG TPA: hypothetical protein VHP83_25435 [Aggregatilineaceae bacterium]|nr:hypothetical protein [Aggregatilineaceae bacterium]
MTFNFMKPDVWDGLVLGVVVVGAALAALRLYSDWVFAQRQKKRAEQNTINHEQTHTK